MLKVVAIVLIVLGVIGLVWGGISYTTEETIVDVGPVEVNTEDRETIPLSPVVSGLALVAGIGLLVTSSRR